MVTLLVAALVVHLLSVPIAVERWRVHRRPFDALVWCSCAASSFCYHLSDALRENVFGMSPSNWLRFSNIAALLLVAAELLFTAQSHVAPVEDATHEVSVSFGNETGLCSLSGPLVVELLMGTACPIHAYIHTCIAHRAKSAYIHTFIHTYIHVSS
jgi:hypothetical protein